MANVQGPKKRGEGSAYWEVKYRTPAGKSRTKRFDRKRDATRFADEVETDKNRGEWLDPAKQRRRFEEYAAAWLKTMGDRAPNTQAGAALIVRKHLKPVFGPMPIGAVDRVTCEEYKADRLATGAAPSSVRKELATLRLVMESAVTAGAIRVNPVKGMRLPTPDRREMLFLTADEVATLTAALRGTHHHALLVEFAAYTGLRVIEVMTRS